MIRDLCSTELIQVIDALIGAGADVYFVGGCVRDEILGLPCKDFDIEIFHLPKEKVEDILQSFGHCELMGKSYGIYKILKLQEADFAIPRKERKNALGHQGFEVFVDPNLEIKEAARRRDFTMNAIYQSAKDGHYEDPFHGLEDIKNQLIRVVDENTFVEDPLRVLRLAQFMARLEFRCEENSFALCKKMVASKELETLSKERVMGEYEKLLLGKKPSLGITFLHQLGALFNEVAVLETTFQHPIYHPEGNAFIHTLMVLDAASTYKNKTSYPLGFMWAALLHDIGKAKTTDEKGHAYNHEKVGAKMALELLSKWTNHKKLKTYVHLLVLLHMKMMAFVFTGCKDKTYLRYLKDIEGIALLNDMVYMTKCDILGCAKDPSDSLNKLDMFIEEKVSRLGDRALKPVVGGEDLIALGYKPGKQLKELLDQAYDLQLGGYQKDGILKMLRRGVNDGK